MNSNLSIEQLFKFRDFYTAKLQELPCKYSPQHGIVLEINEEYLRDCLYEIDAKLFHIFNTDKK